MLELKQYKNRKNFYDVENIISLFFSYSKILKYIHQLFSIYFPTVYNLVLLNQSLY